MSKSRKTINDSFDDFFEKRLKQQQDMSNQEYMSPNERVLRKKESFRTNSSSYGSEDEETTRFLQSINLRKTKGGKRRRTRKNRTKRRRR